MAMTLAEIRAKYPEAYKGVDDKTLADAIYKKYYTHADRREFDARIGINPYDTMGETALKSLAGVPGNIMTGVSGIAEQAREGYAGGPNAVFDKLGPNFKLTDLPKGGPDASNFARWAASQIPTPDEAAIEAFSRQPGVREKYAEYLRNLGPENFGGDPAAPRYLGTDPTKVAEAELKGKLERQEYDKTIPKLDVAKGSPEELVGNVVSSVAQMAPGYAASIVTRNAAPTILLAQTLTQGQSYADARDAGLDPAKAAEYAITNGFAEAAGESLPLGMILKEGGGKLLPRLFKAGLSEAAQEAVTQFIQSGLRSGSIDPSMTWDDVKQQVIAAAAAGAVAGGVLTGGVELANSVGRKKPATAESVSAEVFPDAVDIDMPIEQQLGLPAPDTLLALPSPESFAPPSAARRQPDAPKPAAQEAQQDENEYQARVALQKTKQAETKELLQTARETVTPIGTFSKEEVGGPAAQRVMTLRTQTGRSLDTPITLDELSRARIPQAQLDAILAARRPMTEGTALTARDVRDAAKAKNIIDTDGNFAELAYRATGSRNPERMTQAQLNALKTTLDSLPAHAAPVTLPMADASPFTDDQYGKALDALRNQGRYTAKAIKDATGLTDDKDVRAVRDALVRRGQLVQRGASDFRLYDVIGEERQAVPDDLPPGAFKEHVVRRLPVNKIRIKQNGKSIGTFGSASEARSKVRELRAKDSQSPLALEPAEEVAYGVMENRYDEKGNLLGQVVVDTHRDEDSANKAARELNTADTGARYTSEMVTPTPRTETAPPVRQLAPGALAGRTEEVVKRLNKLASDRKLPLLGVRVTIKPKIQTPAGDAIEGVYFQKLIQLTAQHLSADMSTDMVVDKLAQIMDHETIHALRQAGVLGPETDGWKSIVRYARRAKRPGSNETYFEWANRTYAGMPGYETMDTREEEAIAEAFRHWAANRRNVVGVPATVFRQLVEWFKRLLSSIPEDVFRSIETGSLVEAALRAPGSDQPRARATREMQDATKRIIEAQAAEDENAVRVMSREFLRSQAQAREDRYGRSGPKTVLGTNPSKTYDSADIADRAQVSAIVDRFKQQNGVSASRLMTYLPEDLGYLARVADAQSRAVHEPNAGPVQKAYRALIDETKAMYRAIGPLEIVPWIETGMPYTSAAEMMDDIANGQLKFRLSTDMFGEGADNPGHPMYEASGLKAADGAPLTNNDLLRIVHDIYGHGQSGFRDNPRGQYNAYHEHARLLSPLARQALATETLAQNSWQNYGPHLRRRDGTVPRETDVDYLPPNQKEFAQQKAFVMDESLIGADPGWALAERAAEAVDETPKFSKFEDNLPGGRLYGDPNRSPGGALSKPGTPAISLTNPRPGNQYFGGEMAEEQVRMARDGERGTTIVYLSPEDYLALSGAAPNPEQEVYDGAVAEGYKISTLPSLVIDGYAGNVRAVDGNGAATVHSVVGAARSIPVVLYPSKGESLGLVTAIEGPDGARVPWPKDGRQENIPDLRGPRFSVGSPEFRRWFGDSKVVGEGEQPLVVYHGGRSDITVPGSHRQFPYGGGVPMWFAEDVRLAQNFLGGGRRNEPRLGVNNGVGSNLTPVFLSIRKPFRFETFKEYLKLKDVLSRAGLKTREDQLAAVEQMEAWAAPRRAAFGYEGKDGGGPIYGSTGWSSSPVLTAEAALDEVDRAEPGWRWAENGGLLEVLRGLGYDGVQTVETQTTNASLAEGKRLNRKLAEPIESVTWAPFDAGQIKSAIANKGTWDAANPDIRYSLNAPFGNRVPSDPPDGSHNIVQQRTEGWIGNTLKAIGRSKRGLPVIGSVFDARVKLQDKMLSIKEMIEQIKEDGGSITDLNDTYMLEQLYHGKVFEEIREREQTLQLPLIEALKLAHDGPLKITPAQFEDYLYARHAPERNAYLHSRGATDPNPAGMSDAEANTILNRFALDGKLPELDSLARLADRITADTTRTRVEAGLISAESAAASPYQYYVPLRGFAEEDLDPGNPQENQSRARSGKGFSVGGREDRTVTGRGRKAGDVLGHLFLQNTEAVIRAQKNEVALSFMRLLQENEQLGYGKILKTAPTRKVVGANGMIHEAGDPTYRQAPDIVTAKWKGKEIIARVADPRLARAIKSDYVTTSNDIVNALTKWAGKLNRYLATVNTSLNPEFLISNLARDLQTAGLLSQQYDIPAFGRKVIGNAPKAMGGIREVLRNGTENSEWAQVFREMQAAGGTTEFLGIHDLETQVNRIRRSITQTGLGATPRKAMEYLGKVGKFIDDYNKVAENAFRLSAYKAARDAGVSVKQAAYLAKNLTINFNKGGELKSFMNAAYLFYNASTQGTFVLLNGLKNKRVQRLVGGVVVAGLLQDLLNRAISGDDDENGVPDYDDIPDYVLETNFVLMDPLGILKSIGIDKGYFALPMPYGFNAFFNLGRNMSAGVSGSPVRNPGKGAIDSITTFMDAFNPLGGVQSIWNFVAPTFADPFVDLITNKDFAGNDIVPERPSFGLPVPESQKYWANTGEVPKWVAEHLNRLTGGNEVRPGVADLSPEVLQYALDYATGAVGKFAQRVGKLAFDTTPKALQGDFEDIQIGDIPFARRVVGSVGSRGNTERYYQVAQEVETVGEELKLFEEAGRIDELRAHVRAHPVEVRLLSMFEDGGKTLQDLRKQLRDLRENDAVPAARKRAVEKVLKEQMDVVMTRLNRAYFDAKAASSAAR